MLGEAVIVEKKNSWSYDYGLYLKRPMNNC